MAEENKNPVSEPLQRGAQAASAVRGAVKTGKAIAAAAKGAAAGGPYGAAAGFVWENRKLIGKIIIAVIALLMLPILILCMLPSLIFVGLNKNSEKPILNDNAAINTNLAEISTAVNTVSDERMAEILAQIDSDFSASGADQKEIINPYADHSGIDTNQLIGQYCAFQNGDYETVSLSELENLLRTHKEALYSYTKVQEYRTTVNQLLSVDPDTGHEVATTTTVTKLWATYTVNFCGDDYFAEQVFHLSDEQKALAADYAQNLSLFLADAGAG